MKYMLDTDICITLIRQQPKALLAKLTASQPGDIGLSVVTVAELEYGVEKSARPEQNQAALMQFLLPFALADFDTEAAITYGRVRTDLEKKGSPIGAFDMLIAAHALSLKATLVTRNVREFKRVSGLSVESW